MRRSFDAQAVADAVPQLELGCRFGGPSACSMLGIAHEMGLGMRRDRGLAAALYHRACKAGNMRACANLGELMLRDAPRSAGALALLNGACDQGNARACAVLGRAYLEGASGAPLVSAPLFERACHRGDASGCLGLADLVERGVVSGGASRATELAAMACGRGDERGCARLASPRRAPSVTPASVLAGANPQ